MKTWMGSHNVMRKGTLDAKGIKLFSRDLADTLQHNVTCDGVGVYWSICMQYYAIWRTINLENHLHSFAASFG